jgi:hypothetical protein
MNLVANKIFEYIISNNFKPSLITYTKYNDKYVYFIKLSNITNNREQIRNILNEENFERFYDNNIQKIYLKYNRKDKLQNILK